MFLPTWIVIYQKRRPRLGAPLTMDDYGEIEVGAPSREVAAAAFRQKFPPDHEVVYIAAGSATGFS